METATPLASCSATLMSLYTWPRRRGRTATRSSSPGWTTTSASDYELEFDLRRALEDNQFRLVYQPIYNLDDLTLIGVEALLCSGRTNQCRSPLTPSGLQRRHPEKAVRPAHPWKAEPGSRCLIQACSSS